jgi:hypothetical protein
MFTLQNERDAIEHYMSKHNVDDFVYDGLVGFEAFDLFLTMNEAFMLEFMCAYFDQINGLDTDYLKLPMIV